MLEPFLAFNVMCSSYSLQAGVEWGKELELANGTRQAVEDRCLVCSQFAVDIDPVFGGFDAMVAKAADDEEVKLDVEQGLATMAGVAAKDFHPASVHVLHKSGHNVTRKFNIANLLELRRVIGKDAKAKAFKGLPTTTVDAGKGDGTKELVYIFAFDWRSPLRVFEVYDKEEEVVTTSRLTVDRHYFEKQSELARQHFENARAANCSPHIGLNSGNTSLMTFDATVAKICGIPEKRDSDPLVPAARCADAAAAAVDASDEEMPDRQPDDESVDVDDAPKVIVNTIARACRAAALEKPAPKASGQPPARKVVVAKFRRGRPSSSLDLTTPDGSPQKGADDDVTSLAEVSIAASSRTKTDRLSEKAPRGDIRNEEDAQLLSLVKRNSLDMVAAMLHGKQGVARHHAEDAEDKLRNKGFKHEALLLKNKLTTFKMAESLHKDRIYSLELGELDVALKAVLAEKVQLPGVVCKDLVLMKRNSLVGEGNTSAVFERLMEVVFPWRTKDEAKSEFDPFNPKLRDLDIELHTKRQIMMSTATKVLIALLAGGEADCKTLQACVDMLQARLDAAVGSGFELDSSDVTSICDYLAAFQYLTQLLAPPTLLTPDADFAVYTSNPTSEQPVLQLFRTAVTESPFYNTKLAELTSPRVMQALKELGGQVESSTAEMNAATTGGEIVKALHDVVPLVASLVTRVPEVVTKDIRTLVLQKVAELSQMLSQQGGGAHAFSCTCSLAQCNEMQEIFSEFSTFFPVDPRIPAIMSQVATKMRSLQIDKHRTELADALTQCVTHQKLANLTTLMEQLKLVCGMQLTPNEVNMIYKAAAQLLKAAGEDFGKDWEEKSDCDVDLVMQILSTMKPFSGHDKSPPAGDPALLWKRVDAFAMVIPLARAFVEATGLQHQHTTEESGIDAARTGAELQMAERLQRLAAKAPSSGAELSELQKSPDTQPWAARLPDLVAKAMELVKAFATEECGRVKNLAQEAVAFLTPIQHGLPDGKDWLENLSKAAQSDIKAIMPHAKKTIRLLSKAPQMKGHIDSVSGAPLAENVAETWGLDPGAWAWGPGAWLGERGAWILGLSLDPGAWILGPGPGSGAWLKERGAWET